MGYCFWPCLHSLVKFIHITTEWGSSSCGHSAWCDAKCTYIYITHNHFVWFPWKFSWWREVLCILNFTTFHDLQCHFTTSHQNMSLYQVMPLHLTKSVKEHIAASVGNLNIFRIQQLKALLEESTTSESDSEKSSKSSGDEDRKKRHKKSKVKHKRKESKKHRRKHRKLSKHNDGDRRKDDSREKKDKRWEF